MPELLSDPLVGDAPVEPRAFWAARVATESIPPCALQPVCPLVEFEPSLQTTVSVPEARVAEVPPAALSFADWPVWVPGAALRAVSAGAPDCVLLSRPAIEVSVPLVEGW